MRQLVHHRVTSSVMWNAGEILSDRMEKEGRDSVPAHQLHDPLVDGVTRQARPEFHDRAGAAAVERGLRDVVFGSIEIAGESPSIGDPADPCAPLQWPEGW
jgi:hypothetical protein